MATCILIIGSNRGNRLGFLRQACTNIETRIGQIKRKSSVYESQPWGYSDAISYCNQLLIVETYKDPVTVLHECLAIEDLLGRTREEKGYSGRTMDIDILFIDSLIITTRELTVPHPRIQERNFVLIPLVELIPDFIHPILKMTILELKDECKDSSWVKAMNS